MVRAWVPFQLSDLAVLGIPPGFGGRREHMSLAVIEPCDFPGSMQGEEGEGDT